MNITQARRLLSITEEDDLQSLKKKYHRLMSACHPDALGSERPEHIRRAQEINEAYGLLKTSPRAFTPLVKRAKKVEPELTWLGAVNEHAFRERNIYLYYSMEIEQGHPYYRAARGRYLWEPLEEEFSLFLVSIHELVKELLPEAKQEVLFRGRLFQYLAEQFIDPVKTLRAIAKPERLDKEGRAIYRFPARLKMSGKKLVPDGTLLYPKGFQEHRILVRDREGTEYGHLSFEDDRLYFCLIPLLKKKLAGVRMEVKNGKIQFDFRLEKSAEEYRIPDRNLQIAELLRRA